MDKKTLIIILMAIVIGIFAGKYIFEKRPIYEIKQGTPNVYVTIIDTAFDTGETPPAPSYTHPVPKEEVKNGMDDSIRVYEQTFSDSSGSSVTVKDSVRGVLLRQWVNMKLKSTTITRIDTVFSGGQTEYEPVKDDRLRAYITGGISFPQLPDGTGIGATAGISATHKKSMFYYRYDIINRRHEAGAGVKISFRKMK